MKPARWFAVPSITCLTGLFLFGCGGAGDATPGTEGADTTPDRGLAAGAGIRGGVELVEGRRSEPEYRDAALEVVSPQPGEVLAAGEAAVSLRVRGFEPGAPTPVEPPHGVAVSDEGQHIHLIVDEEPYRAIYDLSVPVDLADLSPGPHLVRAFPARQWHESVKSSGAFARTWFSVRDSAAVPFDPDGPLLTYSRPKGTYEGSAADTIMVDFYLTDARLEGDHSVRLTVDDSLSWDLERWVPHYLVGLAEGDHTVRLSLLGPDGEAAGGEFSDTERRIRVVRRAGADTAGTVDEGGG